MMKEIKVAVAMSGGVDSGVAAALLVKKGYQCVGFHLHLWSEEFGVGSGENKCCNTESLEAARKTAYQLEMPFYTLDFSRIFKKRVVDYFLAEYAIGLTPNPCVRCNKFVKFGKLLEYVRKLGFDYLATGHYARITDGCLFQGKDKTKDQSYFLYNLTQKQLAHILFPVGDYTKKQVRQMARKWKLPVAERPESQEICFVTGNDYRPFLQRHIIDSIKPGEVVDVKGRVIGKHAGLPLYTIGQRHGFEINSRPKAGPPLAEKLIPPFYVVAKKARENQLVVGFGQETEKKGFWVEQVNWVSVRGRSSFGRSPVNRLRVNELWVRVRHQGELLKAKFKVQNSQPEAGPPLAEKFKVTLGEPERGVAPGQAAVFYNGEEVLGGGTIA